MIHMEVLFLLTTLYYKTLTLDLNYFPTHLVASAVLHPIG
jgi:hypothetical protein